MGRRPAGGRGAAGPGTARVVDRTGWHHGAAGRRLVGRRSVRRAVATAGGAVDGGGGARAGRPFTCRFVTGWHSGAGTATPGRPPRRLVLSGGHEAGCGSPAGGPLRGRRCGRRRAAGSDHRQLRVGVRQPAGLPEPVGGAFGAFAPGGRALRFGTTAGRRTRLLRGPAAAGGPVGLVLRRAPATADDAVGPVRALSLVRGGCRLLRGRPAAPATTAGRRLRGAGAPSHRLVTPRRLAGLWRTSTTGRRGHLTGGR